MAFAIDQPEDANVKNAMSILESSEDSISVAIEEINPEDWVEKVYKPDIVNNPERLYKKPGYNPLD